MTSPALAAPASTARPSHAAPTPTPVTRPKPRAAAAVPPAAERHRARLLRYVSRLTAGDAHRAEDIVQETMLRAWLAAGEFADDEDHLAAWLHVVARNLAVDAARRERSVPVGIVPAPLLRRAANCTDTAQTVTDRVTLVAALARLSPRHRDILAHVHLCDRSRQETARLLGIPRGTVKSRTHYALVALRQELPAV